MKKLLFCLLIAFVVVIPSMANQVVVTLLDGRTIEGELISRNDSVVVIKKSATSNELQIKPIGVSYIKIKGEGRFIPIDGKFYPEDYGKAYRKRLQREKLAEEKFQMRSALNNTPNKLFGEALKTTGTICLGFGIPCLAAGFATCIAGHVDPTTVAQTNCAVASYYLLSVGASMTIVGFPLYIKGKKMMELNVNLVENGAGVALSF